MPCPDIVVVGASAGGLEAVLRLVRTLPPDFGAAVFIVIHRGPEGPSILPALLAQETPMPVRIPAAPEPIRPGNIYVAPLDRHLLIADSMVQGSHGPRQHGFRPAVDPLFTSAANSHGDCVAGVMLSGALDDGVAGLLAIKRRGGVAIVQDPREALVPSMPLNALKNVEVDAVLPASEIGPRLVELIRADSDRQRRPASGRPSTGRRSAMAKSSTPEPAGNRKLTPFTCPNCGGALWEVEEGTIDQYECHVGHRFGSEALTALDDDRTENLLWSAVRALQEDSILRRRMAAHASSRGMHEMAERWLNDSEQFGERSRQIRDLIEAMNGGVDEAGGLADSARAGASREKANRRAAKQGRQRAARKRRP